MLSHAGRRGRGGAMVLGCGALATAGGPRQSCAPGSSTARLHPGRPIFRALDRDGRDILMTARRVPHQLQWFVLRRVASGKSRDELARACRTRCIRSKARQQLCTAPDSECCTLLATKNASALSTAPVFFPFASTYSSMPWLKSLALFQAL